VGVTPTPTCTLTTLQAGVCSLLNTPVEAACQRQTLGASVLLFE
jgi:hypothetical protein